MLKEDLCKIMGVELTEHTIVHHSLFKFNVTVVEHLFKDRLVARVSVIASVNF